MTMLRTILCSLLVLGVFTAFAQKKADKKDNSALFNGLEFRSVGPALMSGRVADIAIHPENENIWYVAFGSGGVWKTTNSGTTWNPIFDGQTSYSIGCITLDPNNPDVVWVGTGENVGGRHTGFGDGIYKSEDGGASWEKKGLEKSEHLSKIIIDPRNSDKIIVASQGPLWSKGGQRGVYISEDGGESWERTLGDDEWVGATDLAIDPRDPDVIYAATWQRHRKVAAYMGGGPGTALHKSTDGGKTWNKLSKGLPSGNLGKIGLAISPIDPDVLYAAIEEERRSGGFYRSDDRGASWKKMSDAISGGTGPHYYQEIWASPHQFDKVYFADNYMQVTEDGGKTFKRMNETNKHVDNHAVAFKKSDENYVLVGCDGGLYQSFDNTKSWKFISNLPTTQFYKIAIDDRKPFYNIYGGTQDNNTQGGPSQTDNVHGIRNSDWFITLFGDGHQPATEPGNPNVVYSQWQQGNLVRVDMETGEMVYIQPQADVDEQRDRFNWDAPILVSPHKPSRIYHASQRVWKSEDRGATWETISGDLTNQKERIETEFYGEKQSWDNAWDIYAMSNFSNITSLSESPQQEGLLYAGTDDGIIQVTENGGESWRKINVEELPGVPKEAFVNDIKADLHDANTVFVSLDNHKNGDYKPYLYVSKDKGKSWKSLSGDLPENHLVWRLVQDHEDKNLLFIGTEFGIFVSQDYGSNWTKLKGGMPTISVRDLAIHKEEDDLVAGTFGRSIYILDDYSAFRDTDIEENEAEAKLYKPKDGLWYIQKRVLGSSRKASQGDGFFVADNEKFGVNFTYYQADMYKSKEEKRKAKEKEAEGAVGVPEWETLDEEKNEIKPSVWLFVFDKDGNVIKRVKARNSKGMNRVNWNLSTTSKRPMRKSSQKVRDGYLVAPGTYSAQLYKKVDGQVASISEKIEFNVNPLYPDRGDYQDMIAFWGGLQEAQTELQLVRTELKNQKENIEILLKAYETADKVDTALYAKMVETREALYEIDIEMKGSPSRREVGEKTDNLSASDYLGSASLGTSYSSMGPTPSHRKYLNNAVTIITRLDGKLKKEADKIPSFKEQLEALGCSPILLK